VITLLRVCTSIKGTFGVMIYNGMPVCVTCEDPWNDNRKNISCIPDGEYTCETYHSAKYPNVWEVRDVPGRSLILIHNGNTISHTEGCILVGRGFYHMGDLPMVTDSIATLEMLRSQLPSSFKLSIRSVYEGI
jgi:hypothetical protein